MNNFPAMTEERRQELIKFNRAIIARYESYGIPETNWPGEVRLLVSSARIALAALTAEPKLWSYWFNSELHYQESRFGRPKLKNGKEVHETFYIAPPAPVLNLPEYVSNTDAEYDTEIAHNVGWNACLAEVKRLNSQPAPPGASNEQ